MNGLYEVRKQFSLTQAEMSTWLGVSLSQVAMAETGKRDLPSKALMKLSELALSFYASADKKKAEKPAPQSRQNEKEKISPELKQRIMTCRLNSMKLERKLAKMRAAYTQGEIREISLKDLEKTRLQTREARGERIILGICESKTKKIIAGCGPTQQAILAAQLYAAKIELALLERHSNDHRDTLHNINEKELLKMMKANSSEALSVG